jgi:hypothetical protein
VGIVEMSNNQLSAVKILSFFIYVIIMSLVMMGFIGDEIQWGIWSLIGVILMSFIIFIFGYFRPTHSDTALINWGIFKYKTPSLDLSLGGFMLAYTFLGMFKSGNYNLFLIITYSFFYLLLLISKIAFGENTVGNIFISGALGIFVGFIYGFIVSMSDKNALIFANSKVGAERCGQTKNRNFKCSVYKNGVLLKNL